MSKTLVTGAAGMVGYALRKLSPPETIYTSHEELDLTDFERVREAFSDAKPERVIHLAAVVGGLGSQMTHSGEYFRNNILINLNTLEAARQAGVKKLISFMSTCVFPEKTEYPLREEYLHDGPPHSSNFGYAYAKRMLEVQSSAYRKEWNCHFIAAIPTNIYGPNDDWSLEGGHVLPSLIHRCYLARKSGQPLEVWGSGKPLREFVYSEDIARLSLLALEKYDEDTPIIFSSSVEVSIRELVELVVDTLKFPGRVVWNTSKPDGQYRKPSDNSKMKRYFPDFKFIPLKEGVEKTVAWFEENYPNIRQ
jgi:GDP-L-fucose synthase